jgi:hypothetical protein
VVQQPGVWGATLERHAERVLSKNSVDASASGAVYWRNA